MASVIMTLVLAASLIISYVSRIVFGLGVRPSHMWGLIVASGGLSLLAGILILAGWPGNLWILGLLVAFDIISQGFPLVGLGLALRAAR